ARAPLAALEACALPDSRSIVRNVWPSSLRAIVGLGGCCYLTLHFYRLAGLKVARIEHNDITGLDPVDHFDPVCAAAPYAHGLFNRLVLLNHKHFFDPGKRDQSIGRHAQGPLIIASNDLGADKGARPQ